MRSHLLPRLRISRETLISRGTTLALALLAGIIVALLIAALAPGAQAAPLNAERGAPSAGAPRDAPRL